MILTETVAAIAALGGCAGGHGVGVALSWRVHRLASFVFVVAVRLKRGLIRLGRHDLAGRFFNGGGRRLLGMY